MLSRSFGGPGAAATHAHTISVYLGWGGLDPEEGWHAFSSTVHMNICVRCGMCGRPGCDSRTSFHQVCLLAGCGALRSGALSKCVFDVPLGILV